MTPFEGLVAFVIIWWLVLFMVLPWGVRTSDRPEPGHATSAPAKPKMLLKLGVTTAIALVLWGIAYWLAGTDLISFRNG